MTKADLINEMAVATGYDKKTIAVIAEAFMEHVKSNLVEGENVYLRGFGTFTTKTRKAKVARNITRQTSVFVPEHKIAFFKPAKELNVAVAKL